MVFHVFLWAGIFLLAVVLAGSSLAGDRRRGFLDLILITPIRSREIIDGTLFALWEHLRRVYWIPWVLGPLFCVTGASLPFGVICSLVTATLFLCLVILHGVACSFIARTLPAALVGTIAFPLIVLAGPPALMGLFEDGHGPVLWILAGIFFFASRAWLKRVRSPASVSCYLTAVHLVLTSAAVFWTADFRKDEYPGAAMNPGFITIVTLDDRPYRWFEGNGRYWYNILPCYWTALVLNLIWLRSWLIRHFDWLLERVDQSAELSPESRPLVGLLDLAAEARPVPSPVRGETASRTT